MKKSCLLFYKKEFGSFKARKEKLEKKMGKFISDDLNILLNCRRRMSHELVEQLFADEKLLVKEELRDLKFKLPKEYKKHSISTDKTEEICWYMLYDFTVRFFWKNWNELINGILKPIKDRNPEKIDASTKLLLNHFKKISSHRYQMRFLWQKQFKKITEN